MSYSSTYQRGADLFQAWYYNYIWRHGKLKSDHIKTFLFEMTSGASRKLILHIDRSQSSSGFIEFLRPNTNWPLTITGLGES